MYHENLPSHLMDILRYPVLKTCVIRFFRNELSLREGLILKVSEVEVGSKRR